MVIGFTGPYCTANFGDWAMLVNNIFDFGIENDFKVFTYSSSFPHNVISHYLNDSTVSLIEVKTKEDIHIESATPLDLLASIENKAELCDTIKDLDVLIVSGGGWLDDCWCKRTPKFFKVFAPIILASQLGIPVRFMAQGVGPVKDMEDTLRLFLNSLQDDTVFALRDKYCSPSFLKSLVYDKYPIRFLPDDLAIINPALNPPTDFTANRIESPYIVLVINDAISTLEKNISAFQDFCKMVQNKYGYKTVLLPFDLVWFGADQSKLLNKNVPDSVLIDIDEKKFVSIEETISIISGAKLVLTGRHHAAVIAMQTHTPFILKLDNNRHHYAYNKAHGVLSTFTHNISYDESIFIKNEWDEVFDSIENDGEDIIQQQKSVFESQEYKNNVRDMYDQRTEYIQSIKYLSKR